MDEIFVTVFVSEERAQSISFEIVDFLNTSHYLDVEHAVNLIEVEEKFRGIQFSGTVVWIAIKSGSKVHPVHKLKDKIGLFASQKEEIWDAMNLRIGKMVNLWFEKGKRVRNESLDLSSPSLDKGMKTGTRPSSRFGYRMQM
jgi:hypothetical protein